MAGLVVIDFIDMEYGSNVRKVEKAMKDALKNDRARIQVGRISSFGLMEMSRQRLRTGVLEATTRACPHCDGSGLVRTAGSAGLSALRMIEDEAAKGKGSLITLYASQEATIYVLNAKRHDLAEIEERYGVRVEVIPEGENEGAKMRVGSSGPRPEFTPRFEPIAIEEDEDEVLEDDFDAEDEGGEAAEGDDGDGRRKRRKRRRGRGRDRQEGETSRAGETSEAEDSDEDDSEDSGEREPGEAREDGETPRKRRRRGRRRRGGRGRGEGETSADEGEEEEAHPAEPVAEVSDAPEPEPEPAAEAAPEPVRPKRTRRKPAAAAADQPAEAPAAETSPDLVVALGGEADLPAPAPKRTRRKKADDAVPAEPVAAATEEPAAEKPKRARRKTVASEAEASPLVSVEAGGGGDAAGDQETSGEPRRGWWQRTFGA
jgi:ribonuclease E